MTVRENRNCIQNPKAPTFSSVLAEIFRICVESHWDFEMEPIFAPKTKSLQPSRAEIEFGKKARKSPNLACNCVLLATFIFNVLILGSFHKDFHRQQKPRNRDE